VGDEAELGGVATLEGTEAGEETVGGVAGGGEAGDGATGDLAGDTFGAAAMGVGAGAGEAELINPNTKTKQRSALNRAILSESGCRLRIVQSCVTETVWSRSLPQNENKRYAQEEEEDFKRERAEQAGSSERRGRA
jgi:hypothetical protein